MAYFPNLSIDILAKKSNLKLSDIDIFLNEAKGLNFIKVNNYDYKLASITFLESLF